MCTPLLNPWSAVSEWCHVRRYTSVPHRGPAKRYPRSPGPTQPLGLRPKWGLPARNRFLCCGEQTAYSFWSEESKWKRNSVHVITFRKEETISIKSKSKILRSKEKIYFVPDDIYDIYFSVFVSLLDYY